MKYRDLTKDDFDSIVTGELTHHAIWLEGELIGIISDYFLEGSTKTLDFERLLFRRDGLTFQDKIEIVRGMIPLFSNVDVVPQLKRLLLKVEEFKIFRNAFAHGLDVPPGKGDKLCLKIELIGRSGKEKTVEVTPETHEKHVDNLEILLKDLSKVRQDLKKQMRHRKAWA